MSWRDKTWRYISAAESAKPGYLAQRFKEIREELEKKKGTVTPIRVVKRVKKES